jgi:hypothetical protein
MKKMLLKNWFYIVLILVFGLKYGTAQLQMSPDVKITELNDKWGFDKMSDDQTIDVLLSRRTNQKQYYAYIFYKRLLKQKEEGVARVAKANVNRARAKKRESEWKGWKTYSRTTSNVGGMNHSFVTYYRELYGKTTYVAVHYINGIEKSRSTTTY